MYSIVMNIVAAHIQRVTRPLKKVKITIFTIKKFDSNKWTNEFRTHCEILEAKKIRNKENNQFTYVWHHCLSKPPIVLKIPLVSFTRLSSASGLIDKKNLISLITSSYVTW